MQRLIILLGLVYRSNTDQPRRPKEAGYIYGTLMESTNDTLWILGLSFLENVG